MSESVSLGAEPTATVVADRRFPGLGGAIGLVVLQMALMMPFAVLGTHLPPGQDSLVFALMYVVAYGGTAWFGFRKRGENVRALLHPVDTAPSTLLSLATLVVGSWILLFTAQFGVLQLLPMSAAALQRMSGTSPAGSPVALLAVVVLAPVFEEALFRGVILAGFLERFRPGVAILLSAVLFGLIHGTPVHFVSGLWVGLLAGWLFYRTGSLLPGIAIHAAQNGLAARTVGALAALFGLPREALDGTHDLPLLPVPLILVGCLLVAAGTMLMNRALPRPQPAG